MCVTPNPELIQTDRLDLVLIPVPDLIQLFEDPDRYQLPQSSSFANPHQVLVKNSGPLRWRVPQVKVNPALNKWFVRFIVLRELQEIIGSISFHGAPDAAGMIEIGLEIEPKFQNQGFATEALVGMWTWVCTEPEVQTLRYTVSPNNLPSQRIIAKFGFPKVGQQIDDEDGPEDIYECAKVHFLAQNH
jgi:RimJ/RimL family protein N-acetyltransferase